MYVLYLLGVEFYYHLFLSLKILAFYLIYLWRWMNLFLYACKKVIGVFPGSPVVKIPAAVQGHRFDPDLGTKIHMLCSGSKNK